MCLITFKFCIHYQAAAGNPRQAGRQTGGGSSRILLDLVCGTELHSDRADYVKICFVMDFIIQLYIKSSEILKDAELTNAICFVGAPALCDAVFSASIWSSCRGSCSVVSCTVLSINILPLSSFSVNTVTRTYYQSVHLYHGSDDQKWQPPTPHRRHKIHFPVRLNCSFHLDLLVSISCHLERLAPLTHTSRLPWWRDTVLRLSTWIRQKRLMFPNLR